MKLVEFEYCECGCHGSEATLGNHYVWLFDSLPTKNVSGFTPKGFHLYEGHGSFSKLIGEYSTFEEAQKAATDYLVFAVIDDYYALQEELKNIGVL